MATRRALKPSRWGLALSIAASLVALLLTAAGVLVLGWLGLGRPSVPHRIKDTSQFFDAIKIGLAVVAGLAAAVGLTVSYRKQRGEEEGAFTARYSSAADQLGHDKAAVRLAGVYAMARLADDWQPQQQTCIDVLCAYLRMPYDPEKAAEGEREVRQSVVRLIRNHLRGAATVSWQGRDLDFTGALFDDASFEGATFSGGGIYFDRATFSGGQVSFDGATFSGGQVSFVEATFSGRVGFVRPPSRPLYRRVAAASRHHRPSRLHLRRQPRPGPALRHRVSRRFSLWRRVGSQRPKEQREVVSVAEPSPVAMGT